MRVERGDPAPRLHMVGVVYDWLKTGDRSKMQIIITRFSAKRGVLSSQPLASPARDLLPSPPDSKLGFALSTNGKLPVNGLRHRD
jgi:hypothetical protein